MRKIHERKSSTLSKRLLRRKAALIAAAVMLAGVGVAGAQAVTSQPSAVRISPASDPSAGRAADIQSIMNIWYAYSANIDSGNDSGVAAIMTPTGGISIQNDNTAQGEGGAGMYPGSCAAQPGGAATRPCIPNGGCGTYGFNGVQAILGHYMPDTNANTDDPWSNANEHQQMSPVVVIAPNGKTATQYVYFNAGRYLNTYVKTSQGWKLQWERLVWNNSTFNCYADWSSAANNSIYTNTNTTANNTVGILGLDLYYLQLPLAGPQIPVSEQSNSWLARANSYVARALNDVNDAAGASVEACTPINNLVSALSRKNSALIPGLNAINPSYQNYLVTIANRFLADDACNGLTPPDHYESTGMWSASTAWEGYEISVGAGAVPQPSNIAPFSTVAGSL